MRLLIIGASGFIGSNLLRYAVAMGHDPIAVCRSGTVNCFDGQVYKWQLGMSLPVIALEKIDCAVHLAHDFNGLDGALLTQEFTLKNIVELRKLGVSKQIFFSSCSASRYTNSIYGKTKMSIEEVINGWDDVVIARPGLVLGDGGIYGRIKKLAEMLPIIPLPDGGSGKVPVISIKRLCEETLMLAASSVTLKEANLFEPKLLSLRQLVLEAASKSGKNPWIMPIPAWLVAKCLTVAEIFRIPLPVNADNLRGFLFNQGTEYFSTIKD